MNAAAPGLWCWSAPHPEWKPGHGWDQEVWAYCVDADDAMIVIDPIAPAGAVPDQLDGLVAGLGKQVVIALSRAGHFRDSALFAERYDAPVYAAEQAAQRAPKEVDFRVIGEGSSLPGGAVVLPFDVPGLELDHTPLYLASHRAIAPGDILVRPARELLLWWVPENDEDVRFLNERHIPVLRRWLERPVDHILTSHGEPVLGGGADELAAALARPTWAVS